MKLETCEMPLRKTRLAAVHAAGWKDASEAEAVARELRERATERIQALGQMTTGIAHDFRNILAVIQSSLSLAEDNSHDPGRQRACLDAAKAGVARGVKMATRLLAFAARQELDAGRHDLNLLLRDIELFLNYAAGPGITLSLRLSAEFAECMVDPAQFNAAILNLVVNARDAMPGGGTISIETAVVRGASRDGRNELPFVRLRVTDQGSGMPPHVADRIFEPFFTTKGAGGTGLGVPQVHAFMKSSGGHLAIDSAVGRGTTFDLFFPALDPSDRNCANLGRQLDRWINEGGAREPILLPPASDGARPSQEE